MRRKPNTVFSNQNVEATLKHGGGSVLVFWVYIAIQRIGGKVFYPQYQRSRQQFTEIEWNLFTVITLFP